MGTSPGTSSDPTLRQNADQGDGARQGAAYSADSAQDLGNGIGLGSGFKTGLASSADWKDTLRPVTFKGVVFPTTQVKDSSGRKLVKHVYPYRDGQELVDLGRTALTINISAIFVNEPFLVSAFGKDLYPGRYAKLIDAINEGTSGELVHPVFGSLTAACESYNDTTQATEINTVRLELTFVEDQARVMMPVAGTAAIAAAETSGARLDSFAAATGVNTEQTVGTSFSDVVEQVKSALLTPGKNASDISAELALAALSLDTLTGALPALNDPINTSAAAETAALRSTLKEAGEDYLAAGAPVVLITTTTQTTTVDIAKERYLDPGRAVEIERLNDISDPLSISAGTKLKVYAY
jgi:prophage DNA circulation protein